MREILFRGKRVDNGEWVYGYYFSEIEFGDNGGVEHMYRETATQLHYIIAMEGGADMVFAETVSQYTGLDDMNGKKIFNRDTLDAGDRIVKVKWNKNCACWDSDWLSYKGERKSNGVECAEWNLRCKIICS